MLQHHYCCGMIATGISQHPRISFHAICKCQNPLNALDISQCLSMYKQISFAECHNTKTSICFHEYHRKTNYTMFSCHTYYLKTHTLYYWNPLQLVEDQILPHIPPCDKVLQSQLRIYSKWFLHKRTLLYHSWQVRILPYKIARIRFFGFNWADWSILKSG